MVETNPAALNSGRQGGLGRRLLSSRSPLRPGQTVDLKSEPAVSIPPVNQVWSVLAPLQGVTNKPEGRGPQTNEQSATLGVPSLILIHCLRTDPETDAQTDRTHRGGM